MRGGEADPEVAAGAPPSVRAMARGWGDVSEKESERLWLVTECEEVPERCPGKGKKIQFGHSKLSCPADEL